MIQEFVDQFMEAEEHLKTEVFSKHPACYKEIVGAVVDTIEELDSDRIHEINDGDYQGSLVYVIAEDNYSPYEYWYVQVAYGSCTGCDTLQAIGCYDEDPPTVKQILEYWTLALHIVQQLKPME